MDFIYNSTWQALCLASIVTWLLLVIREVYRFRLLRTRFGTASASLALIFVLAWIGEFLAIVFVTGLISALLTYSVLFVVSCMIFTLVHRRISSLFHPESIAKSEYERAMHESIIRDITTRDDIQKVLSEYGQSRAFLEQLMERLVASGSSDVLQKISIISNLKYILDIYAHDNWTDESKFVAISNYLEYGRRS